MRRGWMALTGLVRGTAEEREEDGGESAQLAKRRRKQMEKGKEEKARYSEHRSLIGRGLRSTD